MLFKRIKDWATRITAFRAGDVIPVDGPSGTAKMSKDDLLIVTARNAIDNVEPLLNEKANKNDVVSIELSLLKNIAASSISKNGYAWGIATGELVPTSSYDCTCKIKTAYFNKAFFNKNFYSAVLWKGDGTFTVLSSGAFIDFAEYPDYEYAGINFETAATDTTNIAFELSDNVSKDIPSIEAALSKNVSADKLSMSKYVWARSTGKLAENNAYAASKQIKVSFFDAITFSLPFISAVLWKGDGTFTVIDSSLSLDLTLYREYEYVGFNFNITDVSSLTMTFEERSGIVEYFGEIEKVCYPDFVERKRWIYKRANGDFIYYGDISATKKFLLQEFEYIRTNKTPVTVLFWKEDGTFFAIDGVSYVYSFKYSQYKFVSFNFNNSDLEELVIYFARKVAKRKVPNTGYYYKPNPEDIGNMNSGNSWGDCSLMTSEEFVDAMYEPLRSLYPNYVTRKNIGKDESGLYDMWAYEFTPEGGYEYTVYLQSGVHSMFEKQAYCGLAILMNKIAQSCDADKYDPLLCMLRQKVRFLVVPIVNVWNVSETAKYNKGERLTPVPTVNFNVNNVNLNRDWFNLSPQREVLNVKGLLEDYNDIIFGYDFHTDPEGIPGWGSYLLVYPNDTPMYFANRLKRVCSFLYEKNKLSLSASFGSTSLLYKAFEGESKDYPSSSAVWGGYATGQTETYSKNNINNTFAEGFFQTFGILSATIEHGARKFGVGCDNDEMVAAVELLANQIIEQVRCNVNLEKLIHSAL